MNSNVASGHQSPATVLGRRSGRLAKKQAFERFDRRRSLKTKGTRTRYREQDVGDDDHSAAGDVELPYFDDLGVRSELTVRRLRGQRLDLDRGDHRVYERTVNKGDVEPPVLDACLELDDLRLVDLRLVLRQHLLPSRATWKRRLPGSLKNSSAN